MIVSVEDGQGQVFYSGRSTVFDQRLASHIQILDVVYGDRPAFCPERRISCNYAFSIGLKSGLYGDRRNLHPALRWLDGLLQPCGRGPQFTKPKHLPFAACFAAALSRSAPSVLRSVRSNFLRRRLKASAYKRQVHWTFQQLGRVANICCSWRA